MIRSFLARGGVWVLAQGILMVAILVLGIGVRSLKYSLALMLAGAGCFGLGAFFGLAGALALGSSLSPFPAPGANARLVRHGVYAWVRHPLYTSVILLSAAWALVWRSGPALGLVVVLALFFDAKARREERWLRERFSAYDEYAQTTRRFIPGLY